MLTKYIEEAMRHARYKLIEDGTFFATIPGLEGVWANADTLEGCRTELQSVLEGWLIIKIREGDEIPAVGRTRLRVPRTNRKSA